MSDSATPWTVALQASLFMGFSRQEYWSGLPFPPPGNFPNPGIKRRIPAAPPLHPDSFTAEPLGKPSEWALLVKDKVRTSLVVQWEESTCQYRGRGFDPWVRKIPWRRAWQPTPVFLPGESHGQRSLGGYSPWGHKRVRHDLATENTHVYQEQWMKTKYIFLF